MEIIIFCKNFRTQPDCDLEKFLSSHNIPFSLSQKPPWPEYNLIESFYGNKKARRSGKNKIIII